MKINNYNNIFNKKSNYNFNSILFIFILILSIINLYYTDLIIKKKEFLYNFTNYIIYNFLVKIKKKYNNILVIFLSNKKLIKINNYLYKKNIINKIKILKYKNYKYKIEELKKLLNIKLSKKNKYIFSKIIYYNYSFLKLIIDKGSIDGINIGQPVLDSNNNIIGYISSVNNNSSYVTLIFDSKCRIPVKISRNKINFIVRGFGVNNLLKCKYFNTLCNTDDIKEGDILVSSGLNNIYPKECIVGKISKITKNNYYLNIEVKTLFNIYCTNYLVIINK